MNLAIHFRRPDRNPPSPLWLSRCRGGRIVVSPSHDDFPALLAEAIDVLDTYTYDVKTAASALGCSASQLIKFLKCEPRAFQVVNRAQENPGASPFGLNLSRQRSRPTRSIKAWYRPQPVAGRFPASDERSRSPDRPAS